MKSKEELKRLFENGDIPKQEEFWEWQESYWHKDEQLPVDQLDYDFSQKADLVDGKVPASQLPSYVHDILEFDSVESLPNPGEKGKIYLTKNNNIQLRWSGSEYIQISLGKDLMTTNTYQEVTGTKRFFNAGNSVNDLNLQLWGKNGAKAGVFFYSEGMDTAQINFDGYFNFKNQNDDGYRNIKSAGFIKDGYNNGFILLAGGGHVPISEFITNSDFNTQLSLAHKIDSTGNIHNGSSDRSNKSWFDYNWANAGAAGSVINFSGLNGAYSTEIFSDYQTGTVIGMRTRNGDEGVWNEPAFLWHDKNLNPDALVPYDNATKDINLAAKKITFAENGNIIKKQNNIQIADKVYQNYYDAGVHNGILSVKFPEVNPNPTMLTVDINIYGYGSRYLGKLTVSFYKYLGGIIANGSNAVWEVTDNFPATLVRAGMKGDGYISILLGEPNTAWGEYFSLEVSKVKTQYGEWNRDWTQDWFDVFENNISDYTTLIDIPSDVVATRSWIEDNLEDNYWKKNDISSTYWGLDSDRPIALLNNNMAQAVYAKEWLASDNYLDSTLIPTNGIYSKGNIKTLNYGSAIEWAIAYNWTQNEGATTNWVNQNYISKTHPANNVTSANIGNWLSYTNHNYNMSIQPDQVVNNEFQTGFGSWNNNGGGAGGYMDYIHFGGYSDSSGGNQNLIAFRKNGPGLRQFQNTKGSPSIYGANGSYVDYWHTGNFDPANYVTQLNLDNQLDKYIPLAGTNSFTGVLQDPNYNFQFGKHDDYEALIRISDQNNANFGNASFQLYGNVEEGFGVNYTNDDYSSSISLSTSHLVFTVDNFNNNNTIQLLLEENGFYAGSYINPISDTHFVQKKYIVDNFVTSSQLSNCVTLNTPQTIMAEKTFMDIVNVQNGIQQYNLKYNDKNIIWTSREYPHIGIAYYQGTGHPYGEGWGFYSSNEVKVHITYNSGLITTLNYGNSAQWIQAYNWGNHASAGYAQAWENASAIGFESGNPEQPYIYHNIDGPKFLATTDWVHSKDYTTPAFVEESINAVSIEITDPNYPIYATNKFVTIIITDEFTSEYIDWEMLNPEQNITVINTGIHTIDLNFEGKTFDRLEERETSEYYINKDRKLIKKANYKETAVLIS
ncbi:hypothetical protein [Chryseobacterium chendengshani]|uniref:hypothetical protein n=1 Tax=Chryseobacterium sp. LJ756 TaxID=2864113 RepID=UPI001C641312|nr:hypothetical protein [Chryseobacterium sp. LJ756]MBW7675498.1 hypothetical protein [Chryseobacterium sp. LJ756]